MSGLLQVLTRIKAQPWAITPVYMETILEIASRENMNPEAIAAEFGTRLENTYDVEMRDGVAILPVSGPLFRYANLFTALSGASSYQLLARDFNRALESDEVRAIVLNIDSPGGEANGVSEFADMIFNARGTKPIIAYVGGTAASAAYWLAAAADEIIIEATADVGSIGVVVNVVDSSERDKAEGIRRFELVSTQSPFKRVNVSEDAGRGKVQEFIDILAEQFIEKVAMYRGTTVEDVMQNFGQGWVRVGRDAVEAGMADELGTFESVVAGLTDGGNSSDTVGIFAANGNQTKPETNGMTKLYLTQEAPKAEEDQSKNEATAANIEQLCPDAAKELQAKGATAKQEEMEGAVKAAKEEAAGAVTAERTRIQDILASDAANGRGELAQHLAFSGDMEAEAAIALLEKSPKSASGLDPLSEAMKAEKQAKVGADTEEGEDEIGKSVARSAKLGAEFGIE